MKKKLRKNYLNKIPLKNPWYAQRTRTPGAKLRNIPSSMFPKQFNSESAKSLFLIKKIFSPFLVAEINS